MGERRARVGDTIELPLTAFDAIFADDAGPASRRNVRDRPAADDPELAELAASIHANGLICPISVYREEGRPHFWVAAGFRRVLAMRTFADRYGFRTIRANVVDADRADLIRLAENFNREDPTTYETCRYLAELKKGTRGRRRTVAELARAVGVSERHIQRMIRLHTSIPEAVQEVWRADRDRRFTYRRLVELAQYADELQAQGTMLASDIEAAVAERMRQVLDDTKTEAAAKLPPVVPGEPQPARAPARLGRRGAGAMVKQLQSAGSILEHDDVGRALLVVLKAVAGEASAAEARTAVNQLLKIWGVDARDQHLPAVEE